MQLHHERLYPWLFGFVAFTGSLFIPKGTYIRLIKHLIAPSLGLCETAVGFLAITIIILIVIDNRGVLIWLKTCNYYNNLLNYVIVAINASFWGLVISALVYAVSVSLSQDWLRFVFSLWIGLLFFTIFSCYRVIQIVTAILKSRC